MNHSVQNIAAQLRQARERKGLSQRELATRTGIPQSQISRIENGAVDLRLSSLIEIARVLDLEPMLVSRKAVPAVQSLARTAAGTSQLNEESSPAYTLDDDDNA